MPRTTPRVSIIMPTYNRADTIRRAIASAKAQGFRDWELVIVDDGSTDGTSSLLTALLTGEDPRIVVIRQENRGFVEARNTGLRAARGECIAFLDSDDEWKPHHLELCMAFLDAFPDEKFVATELLEDFGNRVVNHYQVETSEWYPQIAAQIHSRSMDLPAGETDDYMRVYTSREPIGGWGADILRRAGIHEPTYRYSGKIFEHLRWGFVIAVNSLVLRRAALEAVGPLDARYHLAADQHLIAKLSLKFRANYLGTATYIKHELAGQGVLPAESHLATGKTATRFLQDMLRVFDDLFWLSRPNDPELAAIRGLMQFDIAQVALKMGQRDLALTYLAEARSSSPRFWRATWLECLARCIPSPRASAKIYSTFGRGTRSLKRLARGEISPGVLLNKTLATLKGSTP